MILLHRNKKENVNTKQIQKKKQDNREKLDTVIHQEGLSNITFVSLII